MGFMPASQIRKLGSARIKPHPTSMGGFSKVPGHYGGPINAHTAFHSTHKALHAVHKLG